MSDVKAEDERVLVIYDEPFSSSIHYRPFFQSLEDEFLFPFLCSRIRVASQIERIIVLHHYDEERIDRRFAASLEVAGVTPVRALYKDRLQSVSAYLQSTNTAVAVLANFEGLLFPADLSSVLLDRHIITGNDFTSAISTIDGPRLSAVSAGFIGNIAEFSALSGYIDLEPAVEKVLAWTRVTGQQSPISLRTDYVDVRGTYKLKARDFPDRMEYLWPREVECLVRSLKTLRPLTLEKERAGDLLRALRFAHTQDRNSLLALGPSTFTLPDENCTRPIKVLFISNASAFSGAEESLCTLVEALDHSTLRLSALVTLEGIFTDRLRGAGVNVTCAAMSMSDSTLATYSFVADVISREMPHVIHLNGFESTMVLAAVYNSTLPIIQHARNGGLREYSAALEIASMVVAVSEYVAESVVAKGVDPSKVHILYDEVNTRRFDPAHFSRSICRAEVGIEDARPIILMVARLVEYKRHDLMLNALAIVKRTFPSVRLLMVCDSYADNPLSGRINDLVATLGLAENVDVRGFTHDVRPLMCAADCLVLCSDGEALGRCVVEALSMELPVVVTSSGGTHEVVHDGTSGGLVVPSGDAASIANKIVWLLTNTDRAVELGRAGRTFAVESLDARRAAARFTEWVTAMYHGRAVVSTDLAIT